VLLDVLQESEDALRQQARSTFVVIGVQDRPQPDLPRVVDALLERRKRPPLVEIWGMDDVSGSAQFIGETSESLRGALRVAEKQYLCASAERRRLTLRQLGYPRFGGSSGVAATPLPLAASFPTDPPRRARERLGTGSAPISELAGSTASGTRRTTETSTMSTTVSAPNEVEIGKIPARSFQSTSG